MHDNDPEMMSLIPGIIVEPSLQEKYVSHSKENIHSEAGNLQSTLLVVKVHMTSRPSGPLATGSNWYKLVQNGSNWFKLV